MLVRSGGDVAILFHAVENTQAGERNIVPGKQGPTAIGTVMKCAILARRELLHPHSFPSG